MRDVFHLEENRANVITEVVAGVTNFLTVSYTLVITPMILADSGLPFGGVFVASALASAFCTLLIAFYANTPFAVAPGMGLNAFFAHTMCVGLGMHWREAMAVVFLASLLQAIVMASRLRPLLLVTIPNSLKYATSAGVGMFIAFVGMKNANLVAFTISPGSYVVTESGMVLADSSAYPSLISRFTLSHLVFLVGLATTLFLFGMEKRTGDRYAPFLLGIVTATFVGIPLDITDISNLQLVENTSFGELGQVFCGFFGDPGLLSLAANPKRLAMGLSLCFVLAGTGIIDSVAAIIGIGLLDRNQLFPHPGAKDARGFETPNNRLDRCLIANSFGGAVSALFGTSTSTVFIESVTGIASGGRTGLAAVVTSLLFLVCLPLAGFFAIIPAAALAPALIIAGLFLISLVSRIDWSSQEEGLPAGLTILFIAVTYNVLNGIAVGFIGHLILQVAHGKARHISPVFVLSTVALTLVALMHHFLEWM